MTNRRRARALVVFPLDASSPHHGNRQRLLQSRNLLTRLGFETFLLGQGDISSQLSEGFSGVRSSDNLRIGRGRRLAAGFIPIGTVGLSEALGRELAQLCSEWKIELIFMHYLFWSRALDWIPEDVVKVIDTHDIFANRHRKFTRPRSFLFSCTEREERELLQKSHIVLAINEVDENVLRNYELRGEVAHMQLSLERNWVLSPPDYDEIVIGIFGSANALNVSDTVRLVSLLLDSGVSHRIKIAGGVATKVARAFSRHNRLEQLEFLGEISDLSSLFAQVNVVVIPNFCGTGTSVKFIDAISSGRAVISGRVGSRGGLSTHRLHNLNSIEELITAVIDLSANSEEKLAELEAESRKILARIVLRSEEDTENLRKLLHSFPPSSTLFLDEGGEDRSAPNSLANRD
jgi:hypothetical protein